MKILYNYPLSKYNTIHLGGNAKKIMFPENINDIQSILKSNKKNLIIIGNGSNIAFKDNNYNGCVIILKYFNRNKIIIENNSVIVGAGVTCSKLAKFLFKNKVNGFEFLHGIPGTIGGSMFMNAGAFKNEIWDKIDEFKMINKFGNIRLYKRNQIKISYRKTFAPVNSYFVEARFKLRLTNNFDKNLLSLYAHQRQTTQPVNQWSSGCIFKNPSSHMSASNLIEKAGLKSFKIGGIYISKKHSNYFINDGTGKCSELIALIDLVKRKIKKECGINLEKEIRIIG
ncbi:MAG: UDP-N-acetylenolpyruvoylglucosamine reductase [Gammaproteobacteria bacterium]|nr:UDP-N-acetylenolpyruvoylglucosamine reductase [Gammaproteobacteria bacterium]|tara:strand:+ start:6501 stop:7352 length:852 start_codon:yes stop_codon:yes gene_type:complete